MKKYLLLFALAFVSFNCFSQINFEKGYFINEDNQKVECLIKNTDWRSNPTRFDYKLSPDGEALRAEIQTVKEFSIPGAFKYVRATVDMDRSSDDLRLMSTERNPVFKEEQLFLKVLLEGTASLYMYEETSFTRFFYKTTDTEIKQLIYKVFRADKYATSENNTFRQQLFLDLKCPDISKNDVENLAYNRKELERIFTKYNQCKGGSSVAIEHNQKRDFFNLTIRPGINYSSLSIYHRFDSFLETEFDAKTSLRLGVELEYILPFNRNKWGVIVEPTYQYFKTKQESEPGHASGAVVTKIVDYKSVEIPLSIRHYFYLKNNSSIFINASFIVDLSSTNSSIDLAWNNSSREQALEIMTRDNLALGAGFKFRKRYSIEMRYQTPREILSSYHQWSSDYKTFSVIVGYTLAN